MNNIELLAPAGSVQAFKCAIDNGADAVYLGLQNFNARDKAENFNTDNLREYVKYAHLFGVKVYLTINTLIKDSEMSELIGLVECAVEAKVDAYIVQDLGVARVLKNTFEGIVLHASTQLGVHNLEGALVAKELGFSRVVLARESTLEDIRNIHNNCDIELEYFVQGALCVAFSGNCYFSSLKHNESGNRGRCLQLCRLPYKAMFDNKQVNSGYLLSTNDLCYLDRLNQLVEAGVVSFKIEGRMRRPAYVAQAVRSYRNIIDNFSDVATEQQALKKVFSRGDYNNGYYLDNNISDKIINTKFQNHRGVLIGKVLKCEKFKNLFKITISSKHIIRSGDGLKFVNFDKESSMGVGNVEKISNSTFAIFSKNKTDFGSDVYLTLDSVNEDLLMKNTHKLPINMHFMSKSDNFATLQLKYKNIFVIINSSAVIEKALNSPIKENDILTNLSKLNDTPFTLKNFDCDIEKVFIAKSVLNEMRRKGVEKLREASITDYENKMPNVQSKEFNKIVPIKEQSSNIYYIVDELQNYNIPRGTNVVLAPSIYSVANINKLKVIYNKHNIFVMLPIIKRSQDEIVINQILKSLDKTKDGLVVNNIYGLHYAKDFKVVANYNMNVTNNYTCEVLKNLGVVDIVRSIEYSLSANVVNAINYEGYPALMTFVHCPYKTAFAYDKCDECRFGQELNIVNDAGKNYKIRRTKIANCYFELVSDNKISLPHAGMIDLR